MNPYTNQGNQNYLPYSQQPQYMPNLGPEMQSLMNGFSPQQHQQKMDNVSNASGSPQQQNTSFDPTLMQNMLAKRQMYPPQPFSPTTSTSPAMQQQSPSPMMAQQFRNNVQFNKPMPQQQMRMEDQQRQQQQQFLLMQQQQMRKQQQQQFQPMQQQQQSNTMSPMNDQQQQQHSPIISVSSPMDIMAVASVMDPIKRTSPTISNNNDSDLNTKRVEVILALNTELIRLCIESQRTGISLEPNLGLYQSKLQSNLTYLATMADISMVKPGEEYKQPSPPDLSPLPPPKSDIGKKIHEILSTAQSLFINKQHILRQQQAAAIRQQQFLQQQQQQQSPHMDPQSMLRQAQQAQNIMRQQQQQMMFNNQQDSPNSPQQQISPHDLLNANNLIMNNTNMYSENDPNNYNNVMLMMQRLQQQQQQQQNQ